MTPAVASGLRVMLLPALSLKVYISFSTMSVVSPTPRENNSVCSKIGRCISLNPKSLITSEAVFTIYAHFHDSEGRMSRVPLGALITAIYLESLLHDFVQYIIHISCNNLIGGF